VVIGLPVGYGVSAPPSKPKVAFYNGVPASQETFDLGGREVDASQYAEELFEDIEPIRVDSREEAIVKVRDGEALGALVVPEDITQQLQNATELPGIAEPPTLEVFYNADNPLKRRYVEQTVKARLADANLALSGEVTKVAADALDVLLEGGPFVLPTGRIDVLGLRRAKAVLEGAQRALPARDPQRGGARGGHRVRRRGDHVAELRQPVLGAIAAPIKVDTTEVSGGRGTLEGFAVAAAATIALMFVAVLLGAGMLALEREEHAFGRLVRGLVRPLALLVEKVPLGALCAFVVGAACSGSWRSSNRAPRPRAAVARGARARGGRLRGARGGGGRAHARRPRRVAAELPAVAADRGARARARAARSATSPSTHPRRLGGVPVQADALARWTRGSTRRAGLGLAARCTSRCSRWPTWRSRGSPCDASARDEPDRPPPAPRARRHRDPPRSRAGTSSALLALRLSNRDFMAVYEADRSDAFFTRAGQAREIALDTEAWATGAGYAFAIVDRDHDDRLTGRIALSNVVRGPWQNATMGYWVDLAANGRGHATDAVWLVCKFAFEHGGLHRVQPAIMPRNTRSRRVVEKVASATRAPRCAT
jgi:RimJ/RimL family protein N-acetyltransferase